MQKFRWAYLGCGDIAQITAKELSDGEIVAVWNRTPERAQEFVKKFGGAGGAGSYHRQTSSERKNLQLG